MKRKIPFISFRKIDNEESRVNSHVCIHYLPSFFGVFVDLDKSIEADNADLILGHTGLGCEFYFKKNNLFKMYLEFLPYNCVKILDKDLVGLVDKAVNNKKINKQIQLNDFINGAFHPLSIWLSYSFDSVILFFEEVSDEDEAAVLDRVFRNNEFFSDAKDVVFGINSNTEHLNCIIIRGFEKNFLYKNVEISKDNLGEERMKLLQKISLKFFKSTNIEDFDNEVEKYHSLYKNSDIDKSLKELTLNILKKYQKSLEYFKSIHTS